MQRKFFKHARSIAGTVLVALGIFILHQDLDRTAAQLSHLLGIPGDAPGAFPTVILAGGAGRDRNGIVAESLPRRG